MDQDKLLKMIEDKRNFYFEKAEDKQYLLDKYEEGRYNWPDTYTREDVLRLVYLAAGCGAEIVKREIEK